MPDLVFYLNFHLFYTARTESYVWVKVQDSIETNLRNLLKKNQSALQLESTF